MARSAKPDSDEPRGFSDIVGIIFLALAALLMIAVFSYDRNDLSYNNSSPNDPVHNWIGPVGASAAFGCFFIFGAATYVLPVLLLGFGLTSFVNLLAYLRHRLLWAALFVVAGMGILDLHSEWVVTTFNLRITQDAGSAGGLIGMVLNDLIFDHFGKVGATIVYAALYAISLLYLTNFRLGEWLQNLWQRRAEALAAADPFAAEEKALERRVRDLEKQAKQLEAQAGPTGLGADLKPVPEPTVRDLSVPQSPPKPSKANPTKLAPLPAEPDLEEGEVITAKEIAAATAADVLGRTAAAKPASKEAADSRTPLITDLSGSAAKPKPPPRKPKAIAVATAPMIGNYQLPPINLLNEPDPTVRPTETKEELMANARLMQNTLAQFDIEVSLGDITKGPTITRYELHPAPGVRLERITALNNNIAAALKAERIHILAPVPGKSSVGVEVPNIIKTKVIIRELLESEEWQHTKARIPLALGKDVYGHPIVTDLSEMPHLLIAGSTGSGKSVCINAIISSLLYRFPPDQLRFVMIDPKVVELQQYNSLPHLVVPVVTDPKKVILALRWVVNEMEKRYQIFAKVGVRNIKSFNERPKNKPLPQPEPELPLTVRKEKIEAGADGFAVEVDEEIVVPREEDIVIPEKLSYIVVIIDELADLMLVAPADVEMAIARITQMARAAGIHCIVATQRPSVDVITGVIKANIPARIAFQVAAKVDSRTILDAMGADKLLGKGDMLYLPPGSAKLTRAQGALITDQEIQHLVDFIAKQGKPSYEMEIHEQLSKPTNSLDEPEGIDEDEEIIQQCIEVIRSEQKASVSLLQRRLRLGYTRAARIMDELENRGIVGPSKGAEPRDILIDLDGTGADGNAP
ncbi:MAG: DNA translocase FtsK [Verrucomicrobia bacterium]|nr:DNA translocase FtsK [Verrucomicrobiota bacterium]